MGFENGILGVTPLSDEAKSRARAAALAGVAADRHRRRRLVAGGSVAAGVIVACGIFAYSALLPSSAYASWTAIPEPASISADDPRLQVCTSSIPSGPADLIGSAKKLRPVVTEERGAFIATLLGGGDSLAICIFDDTNRSAGRTIAAPLPTGDSVSIIGNGGSLDKGEGARYVYGRVAEGVEGVTVLTSSGVQVTASVSGGYYLAWWPAPAGPASVTATAHNGTVLQKLIAS
jgi:biotin transporter BioY